MSRSRLEVPGIGASLGIALGPAHMVPQMGCAVRREVSDPEQEIHRLREAIEGARAEIEEAKTEFEGNSETAFVLEAQLLMHRDELLVENANRLIRSESVNAEWALELVVNALKAPLEAADSRYFRERAQDIEHVRRHILRHLRGRRDRLALPEFDVILCASDLSPADAVRLLSSPRVIALVTEVGSATTHTALLARAFGIPAVVGVGPLLSRMQEGVEVLVDGLRGRVVLAPREKERAEAQKRKLRFRSFSNELRARSDEPTTTCDGVRVALLANIEVPAEAVFARAHGAQGIGLYRTEFLYLDRLESPTEEEQIEIYRNVLQEFGREEITIRTFDLGGDKLPRHQRFSPGPNPALGLRAIRVARRVPHILRTQIRAVLRAALVGPLRLMFPMVQGPAEFRNLRTLVSSCAKELENEGIEHAAVPIGAMIEVPSAAILTAELALDADFLCIGTNDLVQYLLVVDRSNRDVAELADPLHPAVTRILASIEMNSKKNADYDMW